MWIFFYIGVNISVKMKHYFRLWAASWFVCDRDIADWLVPWPAPWPDGRTRGVRGSTLHCWSHCRGHHHCLLQYGGFEFIQFLFANITAMFVCIYIGFLIFLLIVRKLCFMQNIFMTFSFSLLVSEYCRSILSYLFTDSKEQLMMSDSDTGGFTSDSTRTPQRRKRTYSQSLKVK